MAVADLGSTPPRRIVRRGAREWRPTGELPLDRPAGAPASVLADDVTDLLLGPPPATTPASGMVTEILGAYLAPSRPRDPVFTPDFEVMAIGSRVDRFATDGSIARCHAALVPTADGVVIEDFGAPAGIFLRAGARLPLRAGDRLRLGRQLLRFHVIDRPVDGIAAYWGRLGVMLDDQREAAAYPLRESLAEIGRDRGDVQFPFDDRVGDPHCWIEQDPDEGPTLVTQPAGPPVYVRLAHAEMVTYDSELLVGDTRLQVRRLDALG